MFEKADQPGWGILVPIYNLILIVRVAGLPEWMFLLLLIPVVNFVAMIIVSLEIRERFSKGVGFTVGLIFLPALFVHLACALPNVRWLEDSRCWNPSSTTRPRWAKMAR